MKNFKFLLSVAVASAFIGCSSMAVDDAEATIGFVPADFNAQEYLELHPLLLRLQIKDYVQSLNRKDSLAYKALGDEAYKAFTGDSIRADKEAFDSDTATVHYILSKYAGISDDRWELTLTPTLAYDTTYKVDTIQVGVKTTADSAAHFDTLYICAGDSIQWNAERDSILLVFGHKLGVDTVTNDTTTVTIDSTTCLINGDKGKCLKRKYDLICTGKAQTFGSDTYSFNTGVAKGKDAGLRTLESDVVDSIKERAVPGTVDKKLIQEAENYNYFGSRNDLAVLDSFKLDTFAISSQYMVFAQEHGWAYRKCKPTDNLGDYLYVQDPTTLEYKATAEYPITKLYCDDNGQARELN